MKYVCKRENGAAVLICASLVVGILVTVTLASFNVWIRGIWELAAMLLAVAAIQVSQRNIFSSYEYIVDPDDELIYRNRITVIRTAGEKRTSLFTLGLNSLVAVIPYEDRKKLKKEYARPKSRYSYCTDIFPKESFILVFENDGESAFVRLQCGKCFAKELEKRMGV